MIEKQIIENYRQAVDEDVLEFVKEASSGAEARNYITVAFLSDDAAKKIYELTGKQVKGNRIVLDANAVRHIVNRHGSNGKQDQSMSDFDDMARIGYVLMNYDEITYDGKTTTGHQDESGQPAPLIKISKRIDGTYYIIEAVSAAKSKRNYVVTAYITRAKEKQLFNP